jgi:beta-phosphoglucomutase-like phosphatase (HAD superfamily)
VSEAQTVVLRREEFDAVVFDMGGVVTKTAAVHAAVWKRLFDDYMGERSRSIFDRVPYVALLPRSL